MNTSLLWVVIIAYKNTSLNIIDTLNSIRNQTYPSIKILVVDTNSPDSMHSLGLQEDLEAYKEVIYLQRKDTNMAALRAFILEYIDGDYVSFLTSNDTWDAMKASLHMEQLEGNPEVGASYSDGLLIDKRKHQIKIESLFDEEIYDASKWLIHNPAKMSAQVIYRIESIKNVGGFDDELTNYMDGDLLIRLNQESKIRTISMNLCTCTITRGQEDYDSISFNDQRKIYEKYLEQFIQKKSLSIEYYQTIIVLAKKNYLWINYVFYLALYVIKAPMKVISDLILVIVRKVGYGMKGFYQLLSLIIEHSYLKLQLGSMSKIKLESNEESGTKLSQGNSINTPTHKNTVSYSSAKEFNRLSPYDLAMNKNIREVIIPEFVTVIKKGMFYGCENLERVIIPSSVVKLSAYAFYGCKNLKEISFMEGSRLSSIGSYAFGKCSSLRELRLPANIASMDKGAFLKCYSLERLLFSTNHGQEVVWSEEFPTGITRIYPYTFACCSKLTNVEFTLGSSLESIDKGAFLNCKSLKKAVFPSKVTYVGNCAFANCEELKNIALVQLDSVQYIGRGAFLNCKHLEYFTIPKQIKRIYTRTFYGCSRIQIQRIPKNVLAIGHLAYRNCSMLDKVVLYSKDVSISPTAFERHTDIETIGSI